MMTERSLAWLAKRLTGQRQDTLSQGLHPPPSPTLCKTAHSTGQASFVDTRPFIPSRETDEALAIYSEPYAPTGNIGDTGILKLLGAPSIDRLQALVRESVQNSCDAAKLGKGLEVGFRLRTLDSAQMNFLTDRVLASKPFQANDGSIDPVPVHGDEPVRVLEITDFNTTGLMGPVRADRIPSGETRTDFVNFFRNVGAARDTHQGGGTYGFGKISLYLASECSTILVDTQTEFRGQPVRRFMASRISDAYGVDDDKGYRCRHTGRHWWGKTTENDPIVDPLEGEDAVRFARMLGMPARGPERKGTTIMLLAPRLDDIEPIDFVRRIAEQLLEQFWPRMTRDTPDTQRINAFVELDGTSYPVQTPEESPQFHLHAQALGLIRANPSDRKYHVYSNTPRTLLGRIAMVKGMNVSGHDRAHSNSIALMRPVGLIVKYHKAPPASECKTDWAGVFIAADDPEVETAFADSEPPAHDDWCPQTLPEGNGKKFVESALRKIKEKARAMTSKPLSIGEGDGTHGQSASRISRAFGSLMNDDLHIESQRTRSQGAQGRPRKTAKADKPTFDQIGLSDGKPFAMFAVKVVTANTPCKLIIDTGIVIDGKLDSSIAHRNHPEILSVTDADGATAFPHSGNTFDIPARFDASIRVQTSLPASATVGLQVRLANQ